ncbi:hypothetical protein EVA_09443 [gut metagenome]|uniref:Uncharacterized protein n=1 Tax=gut metagenome TaxID=749906 RepID=J9G5E0_9ZZZZ
MCDRNMYASRLFSVWTCSETNSQRRNRTEANQSTMRIHPLKIVNSAAGCLKVKVLTCSTERYKGRKNL